MRYSFTEWECGGSSENVPDDEEVSRMAKDNKKLGKKNMADRDIQTVRFAEKRGTGFLG